MKDLKGLSKPIFEHKINRLKEKTVGKLIVEQYPTASAHVGHFRALLKDLELKKKFKPDIIYIDYLNLCSSIRYGYSETSYTYVKGVAEELRGMAVEYDVPIITATQVNREGFKSSDFGMTETSESLGVPMTADSMFAILSPPELKEIGQYRIKHLKSRYVNVNEYPSIIIGVDYEKMRLYNLEESSQMNTSNIKKDVSDVDKTPFGLTFNDISRAIDTYEKR